MREASKLFQPRIHVPPSMHSFADRVSLFFKRYQGQYAVVTVLAVSGSACVVGAVQLASHWDEVTQRVTTTHVVGNIVSHTDAAGAPAQQPEKKATVSVSTNSSSSGAGTSSSVVSSTSSTTNTGTSAGTTVTVNGQAIPVPSNSSISKNIVNDDGSTSVHVSNSSTTGDATGSVNVQVNSMTSSRGGQ